MLFFFHDRPFGSASGLQISCGLLAGMAKYNMESCEKSYAPEAFKDKDTNESFSFGPTTNAAVLPLVDFTTLPIMNSEKSGATFQRLIPPLTSDPVDLEESSDVDMVFQDDHLDYSEPSPNHDSEVGPVLPGNEPENTNVVIAPTVVAPFGGGMLMLELDHHVHDQQAGHPRGHRSHHPVQVAAVYLHSHPPIPMVWIMINHIAPFV